MFKHLVEIQPNNGWHWGCLSTLLETRGAHTEALAAMEKAVPKFRETLSSRPDDIAAHVNLGGVLCDVKYDFEAAATEYREALRIEPDNVKAHFGLGNVFREQDKFDLAAGEYHEALRIKPDFAPANHNLAYVLIRQRNVDRAIAEGRESLRLQPDSVNVPGHLAWILAVYPDRPRAITMRPRPSLGNRSRPCRRHRTPTPFWRSPSTDAATGTTRSPPSTNRWRSGRESTRRQTGSWRL